MTRQLKIQQPFNLALTLTMGQAFRWCPLDDGWFSGVLGRNLIHIRQTDDGVEYRVGGSNGEITGADLDQVLSDYFRLGDDIDAIYRDLSARDEWMAELVQQYYGMRLLRQEQWECVVSYICSANTGVVGIAKKVEAMSVDLGEALNLPEETRYTFPEIDKLVAAGEPTLRQLGVGKPAKYVIETANMILDDDLDFSALRASPYAEAKNRLMPYSGIGDKVADCICLFALDKTAAFPIDTNIGAALRTRYADYPAPRNPKRLSSREYSVITEWAVGRFGENAGLAGQFLFHAKRMEDTKIHSSGRG